MFATTTRPIAFPQPHAAHETPSPEAGAVRRIRVTRRSAVRTHRRRRGAVLAAARQGDSYLVRVDRPAGRAVPSLLRIPATAPHRARPAR